MRIYFAVIEDSIRGLTTRRVTSREAQDITEKRMLCENNCLVFVAELDHDTSEKTQLWFAYDTEASYSREFVQETELQTAPRIRTNSLIWLRV